MDGEPATGVALVAVVEVGAGVEALVLPTLEDDEGRLDVEGCNLSAIVAPTMLLDGVVTRDDVLLFAPVPAEALSRVPAARYASRRSAAEAEKEGNGKLTSDWEEN